MCNKITKIAVQNRYQWVGICSHGSAHLFWRTTHICLSYDKLKALMSEAESGNLTVDNYQEENVLWLNQVAIKLSQDDYHEMLALLLQAAHASETPKPRPVEQMPRDKMVLH